MDLIKNGELLRSLRIAKGLTQKEVAAKLGVVAKTVSKWETGHGFPDVSLLSRLADILGVNERSLINGSLNENKKQAMNVKQTKFYLCPTCGSSLFGVGDCKIVCCGKLLEPLRANAIDEEHAPIITEVENDFYIEFNHEMEKGHYISFVSYVGFDRVLTLPLYPEQSATVRIPKAYNGKLFFYCTHHGLFEYPLLRKR